MRPSVKYTDRDIDDDMKLTHRDYVKILHHYQRGRRNTTKNAAGHRSVKLRAQRILAEKLCHCIKANTAAAESRRIGYCSQAIFNRRGLRHHGFRCKTARGTLRPKLTRDVTKMSRRVRMHQ
jgi:hypothetical protein